MIIYKNFVKHKSLLILGACFLSTLLISQEHGRGQVVV